MLTMTTDIEFIRRTDIMCDESVVESSKDRTVYTIESIRNVKHILI